jgi:hypothetical protein
MIDGVRDDESVAQGSGYTMVNRCLRMNALFRLALGETSGTNPNVLG